MASRNSPSPSRNSPLAHKSTSSLPFSHASASPPLPFQLRRQYSPSPRLACPLACAKSVMLRVNPACKMYTIPGKFALVPNTDVATISPPCSTHSNHQLPPLHLRDKAPTVHAPCSTLTRPPALEAASRSIEGLDTQAPASSLTLPASVASCST
jgi:hypothetical protein